MKKELNIIEKSEFKTYITATYALNENDFDRLLEDFNYYYTLELKEFIRTRHLELKTSGLKNSQIYKQLENEVQERRFKNEALSERQIRRVIYG